jgi:hypothetical protein
MSLTKGRQNPQSFEVSLWIYIIDHLREGRPLDPQVVRQFDTLGNFFVVAQMEEFPKFLKSRTNPDHSLIGDMCLQISLFRILTSVSSEVGWWLAAKSSETRSSKFLE